MLKQMATPHVTDAVLSNDSKVPMKLSNVPQALHSLVPIIQQWGGIGSDEEVYRLAELAESDDRLLDELEQWAASWTREQMQAYASWDDTANLSKDYEFSKFYFMNMLLDTLEIKYPKYDESVDPIDNWILELSKVTGITAQATRMWAARSLSERGTEAVRALPALQSSALNDPSVEVRAWAIAAIGLIDGRKEQASSRIRLLLNAGKADSELTKSTLESALDELNKSDEQRAVGRLRSACITNDLDTISQMLLIVSPNSLDHNGSTAIQYAVGNNHPQALELLLKAGANANDRNCNEPLLHKAAGKRKGAEAIRLLLQFGADPRAKDQQGRTAFDVAVENEYKKNVELLQSQPGAR